MNVIRSPFPDVAIRDLSVTELVFAAMADSPDRVVLHDGPTGRELTAAQVMAAVKALAGGLTARGYGPGTVVAIMAPNLPEYPVAVHAVAWAGGTVTTLNPTYTAPEAQHQLKDSGAQLLITVGAFLDVAQVAVAGTGVREIVTFDGVEGTVPLTDLTGPPLESQSPVDLETHVVALPYSSGTTGLPKGVMLTHRNLVTNADQSQAVLRIRADETAVVFLPFFHIYALEIMVVLYMASGARLVTMPRFDLEQYLGLNARFRAERLWIVPPVAIALAKHPMVDDFDLSGVVLANSAAAPLGGDVAIAVAERLGCVVTQGYGMTELSPVCHICQVEDSPPGSVGQTIPNTECRVVSVETGADVAPGEEGEIWVRGPQVMKGYLGRPDATAEAIDAEGWLHTGDVGRFDTNGHLYITDRVKELIKYKGFQVAPAELEAMLLTHPCVADVAVIGVPDAEAGEVPMAFVVPAGEAPSLEDLQGYCAGRLAHYKEIRRLEITDAVPKSASGKILRRLLRDRVAVSG